MVLLKTPIESADATQENVIAPTHDASRRVLLGAAAALAVSAVASQAEAASRGRAAHQVMRHGEKHIPRTAHSKTAPHIIRPHHKMAGRVHATVPHVYRPNEVTRFSHFIRTPEKSVAGARLLSLYVANTGERASAMYWEDGEYIPAGLREISYLLRDHRTDTAVGIAPDLLDFLHGVTRKIGYRNSVQVVSGYRSPRTNEMLRHHQDGVARNSYHTKGRAIDVVMSGVELRHVRNAALHIAAGGVGYYPDSGFVHLDSGPRRAWNG